MNSYILFLWSIILSWQLFLSTATEYIAQFTLHDNSQPQIVPVGNIISQLQSPFPSGIYQIITRKCSYSKFNQYFQVTDTGDLLLTRFLDRDDINNVCGPLLCCEKSMCEIDLDLIVTLIRTGQKFSVQVLIAIFDENDNSPKFIDNSFSINILENENVQNRFSLPSAYDLDSPTYRIKHYALTGIGEENFSLKIFNNLPFIISKVSFDYEDHFKRTFNLFLIAEDYGGRTGTLNLTINILDANDNAPICLDLNVNISLMENTSYLKPIFTFRAMDLDSFENSKINYLFFPTTTPIIKNTFRLINDTGNLFLLKKLDFELFSEKQYKITIEVSDNGRPPLKDFCLIEIHVTDINDNYPVIDVAEINTIPENKQIKEHVLKFYVRDDDTVENEVTCQAKNYSVGLKLIQEEKYSYFIYASGIYDFEKEKELTVSIICQDNAMISKKTQQILIIPIQDENDNVPKFNKTKYQISLKENFDLRKTFLTMKASDDDSGVFGKIRYELGLENRNYFSINNESGDIFLLKYLDRENQDFFNFTIFAVDGGNLKNYTRIELQVLDVNDNFPKLVIGSPMNVSENIALGSIVGHFIIQDLDLEENGEVEWKYKLINNSSFLLEINNFTIITVGNIDRESNEYLYILITMKDKGSPQLTASGTITISVTDQNDNIPEVNFPKAGSIIEECNGMIISTNIPKYTKVLQIKSHDPDIGINGQILYHTLETNGSRYFLINQTDGSVSVNWEQDSSYLSSSQPKEGLYKISFVVYNHVKSNKNVSASSTSCFFIRILSNKYFIKNEILQQQYNRPLFNNVVLLFLIGTFIISISVAVVAGIIWAKSKHSRESNLLQQIQNNNSKFLMMMIPTEQQSTNSTYICDPFSSLMRDHEIPFSIGYPLRLSKSSTFKKRCASNNDLLLNNYDSKAIPQEIFQPDLPQYYYSGLYKHSNSATDLAMSPSVTGRQSMLTNSLYCLFEHDSQCHSPNFPSINRQTSLEDAYGSILPRVASVSNLNPNIIQATNWIPRVQANVNNISSNYTLC